MANRTLLVAVLAVTGLVSSGRAQDVPLPKPQIAAEEGKMAPDFTLRDQKGNAFHLAGLRGQRVLLIFYRGYWWPYCMAQLREFAQHKKDFDATGTRVVAISVDDEQHARQVWEKVADQQFTILSDPGAEVIRQYGLLHSQGHRGEDIAIRATLLVDEEGRERWRRVSQSIKDIPTAADILEKIRQAPWQVKVKGESTWRGG